MKQNLLPYALPDKPAIITADGNISFPGMMQHIHHFAECAASGRGDRVVIFSENRPGWIYALYGAWLHESIVAPIDAGSTEGDIRYILTDSTPVCIWTSRTLEPLLRKAAEGIDTRILIIDDYEQANVDNHPVIDVTVETTDTALIIYTSGTTGSPKGVMLTYDNCLANVLAVSEEVPIYAFHRRVLVLLPLHHVLPLMGSVIAPFYTGGGVSISPSLAPRDIMDALCRGRVGIVIGVPRLWQMIYLGVKGKIDGHAITRLLFKICKKLQWRGLSRFVFSSVRKKMGGCLDYCVSGGAALEREVGVGLKTLGLDVLEGYGMTECAPMISFTHPGDIRPGCSGLPLSCCQVELRDGEIYVKGSNVMQGYYNRMEETREVLSEDGWLRTGDLGCFDAQGRLTITGRVKEIIVLPNGKNIQPAELEAKLMSLGSQWIDETAVLQDGDYLRAIIVPKHDWAEGRTDADIEQELKNSLLEVYNQSVAHYKRIVSLFISHEPLPRTRLEKLQRFRLPDIINRKVPTDAPFVSEFVEPASEEYRIIKQYIRQEKRCEVRPNDGLLTDLALDSLDRLALEQFIDSTFGMTLTDELLERSRTVAGLAAYVSDFKTRIEVDQTDWHSILMQDTSDQPYPKSWPTMRFFKSISHALFNVYFAFRIRGERNFQTPCIYASNHQSYLDGLFVMAAVASKNVRHTFFVAKEQHLRRGFIRFLASKHNVIALRMSDLRSSILQLGEVLKRGDSLIIFPEGTRTETGMIGEFKRMFAILAVELQVPIVPLTIKGAFRVMPKHSHFPRIGRVSLEVHEPIMPEPGTDYDILARQIRNIINHEA